MWVFFAIMIVALLPDVAHAYIGPGLAAGTLAAVLGVIGAALLALFALVYYPIKRMLRNGKATPAKGETAVAGDETADPAE